MRINIPELQTINCPADGHFNFRMADNRQFKQLWFYMSGLMSIAIN